MEARCQPGGSAPTGERLRLSSALSGGPESQDHLRRQPIYVGERSAAGERGLGRLTAFAAVISPEDGCTRCHALHLAARGRHRCSTAIGGLPRLRGEACNRFRVGQKPRWTGEQSGGANQSMVVARGRRPVPLAHRGHRHLLNLARGNWIRCVRVATGPGHVRVATQGGTCGRPSGGGGRLAHGPAFDVRG